MLGNLRHCRRELHFTCLGDGQSPIDPFGSVGHSDKFLFSLSRYIVRARETGQNQVRAASRGGSGHLLNLKGRGVLIRFPECRPGGGGHMIRESTSTEGRVTSEKARYLVVVSRNQSDLWQYLTQNFAKYKGLEFVLDRRYDGRWPWAQMPDPQEWGLDRRCPSSVDSDLRYRAFVIVPRREGPERG